METSALLVAEMLLRVVLKSAMVTLGVQSVMTSGALEMPG